MSRSVDFSLRYNRQNGQLYLKLYRANLMNQHPAPFVKVQILPTRRKPCYRTLDPPPGDEIILPLKSADLETGILEMIFFDVNRYLSPAEFMGILVRFHRHECLGTIQLPINGYNLKQTTSFSETIVKCEDRGWTAQNICQLRRFEEDFKAFCTQFFKPSGVLIDFVNEKIVNPVFLYLVENIEGSRGPVLYFTGRNGAGKSSLINALANIHIAEVSDIESTSGMPKYYSIDFDSGSSWTICDTCGLEVEDLQPDQSIEETVSRVKKQIVNWKPDVILYTISAKDVDNCFNELNLLFTVLQELKEFAVPIPPVFVVITHTDLLGTDTLWPPEEFPSKKNELKEFLVSTADRLVNVTGYSPIDADEPYRGYITAGRMPMHYLIPVALPQEGATWNIDMLAKLLGKTLPTEARFQFCQPQQRPFLMKEYSTRYIHYFSGAAVAVGGMPIPGSETLILTALQLLMVCILANTAGRELNLSSAGEFMTVMGTTYVVGQGCLRLVEDIIKFLPIAGPVIAATVSGANTYAMGRAAQAYFFDGQIRNPLEFRGGQ